MPSTKKRINLTVDNKIYAILEKLSGKRQQKISTLSLNLLQQALELQEDIYFSRIVDERLSQKQKRISHNKAWETK